MGGYRAQVGVGRCNTRLVAVVDSGLQWIGLTRTAQRLPPHAIVVPRLDCIVCLDEERQTLCMPCNCLVLCAGCATKLTTINGPDRFRCPHCPLTQ